MITVLAALVGLVAVACWVCLSPARAAIAGVSLMATHPALTLAVTTTVAVVAVAVGSAIVWRSLRASPCPVCRQLATP